MLGRQLQSELTDRNLSYIVEEIKTHRWQKVRCSNCFLTTALTGMFVRGNSCS